MEELGQFLVEEFMCDIGAVLGQGAVEGGPPRLNGVNNICRIVQRGHQVV